MAILGQPRDGPLARRIAAHGGRVVPAVGTTTTMLVVIGEESFGFVRYDAQFKRAAEIRRAGGPLRILSERELAGMLAARQVEATEQGSRHG